MAILFSEGFDKYTLKADLDLRYTRGGTAASVDYNATDSQFTTGALKITDVSCYLQGTFASAVDASAVAGVIHAVFWMKAATLPGTTQPFFIVENSAAGHLGSFKIDNAGSIIPTNFNDTVAMTGGTTATGVIIAATWQHIEIAVLYKDSGGFCKIWVDGTLVTNISGLDLNTGGTNSAINKFRLQGVKATGNTWFDDFFAWDETGTDMARSTQMNKHKIETLSPTADDTTSFGTVVGTGSTHADRVKETGIDDGDTTYVESTALLQQDLYTVADQASVPVYTFAVAVHARWKQVNGAVNGRVIAKVSSTQAETANVAVGAAYEHDALYMGQNPSTVAAWGNTDVNSVIAGTKHQS